MHAALTVPIPVSGLDRAGPRHRFAGSGRNRGATTLVVRAGSVISMAALALVGTAVAAGLAGSPPPPERSTATVTYGLSP